jgi:cysteine desulfurase/selenocysteine lyase
MLGPTGIGVLYGKKDVLQKMVPFQGGGEMIKEVSFNPGSGCSISWNDLPWKFEAGTPDICGAIGLAEAVKYLEALGMDQVLSHEKELTKYAVERLQECNNVVVHGSCDLSKKCGIIPFSVKGLSSHDVALICDNYGIMIRSGYHCAQPLHEQILKLQSSDRASFYIYNTKEEIDRFVEVLKEIGQQ